MGLFGKSPEKLARERQEKLATLKQLTLSNLKMRISGWKSARFDENQNRLDSREISYQEYDKYNTSLNKWADEMEKVANEYIAGLTEDHLDYSSRELAEIIFDKCKEEVKVKI